MRRNHFQHTDSAASCMSVEDRGITLLQSLQHNDLALFAATLSAADPEEVENVS